MNIIVDILGLSFLGFILSRAISALRYTKKTFSQGGVIHGHDEKGFDRDVHEDVKKNIRQKLIDFQSSE